MDPTSEEIRQESIQSAKNAEHQQEIIDVDAERAVEDFTEGERTDIVGLQRIPLFDTWDSEYTLRDWLSTGSFMTLKNSFAGAASDD